MSVVVIKTCRVRGWGGCHGPSELGIMGHISKKIIIMNTGSYFLLWEQIVDVEDALMEMSLGSMEGDIVK